MDRAPDGPGAALARLLERQRGAIRAARFGELAALAAEAGALADRLALGPPLPEAALRDIGRRARQVLHEAACAREGLRAARATVAAIRSAAAGLVTYDGQGRSGTLAARSGAVERRA